ncbi:neuronal PAS domain-containing protein 4-like [Thalassophryne amazonica]|uniref:neuronal PAS domain-containing protein 4-like n=1 Tax=Thalassophryne amazonica TaxID=390379 RepID=UPI001471AB90|nr:neuronal PAS domain-containing protein 4-like [Thalassophryne amazonica]
MVSHRSTKGASKARRDHINREIRNLRSLLPISQKDQERLSYLHSMAAICTYIRKSVLLQGVPAEERPHCSLPYEAFLQALHGFILVTTSQGRLVYVSENVSDYTGISMVNVLQGDTLYDMVERSDIEIVKSHLDIKNNPSSERSFVCCLQTSKAFKLQHGSCYSVLVKGSFRSVPEFCPSSSACPTNQPLFVALCTPTVNRLNAAESHFCPSFSSVHKLDMSFTQLSDSVLYFLGYSAEEMTGRLWYSFVHPEDLSSCADSHKSLIQADEGFYVEMVLRLQCKDLSWTWLYIQALKDSEGRGISCTNYIISEAEARFLQKNICSNTKSSSWMHSSSFAALQVPQTLRFKRLSDSFSEELDARTRRDSDQDLYQVAPASSQGDSSPASVADSPTVFTLSCSSSSPLQGEELSHDLLMDVEGYTDQLLSSPECSPSYFCYPEAVLAPQQSPSGSLPAAAQQTFEHEAFQTGSEHSALSSSSPTYDFQASASIAQLVPDDLSVSDVCRSPADRALHQDNFSLLEQPQGSGVFHEQHVPDDAFSMHALLLTPNPSPTSLESDHYREQAEISILAQQIISLANNFNKYRSLSSLGDTNTAEALPAMCRWPPPSSACPLKEELLLDDYMCDSILKDLDAVTSKPAVVSYQENFMCSRLGSNQDTVGPNLTSPEDSTGQFTAESIHLDPFNMQWGRHDQNTGLHQLSHYMQSSST